MKRFQTSALLMAIFIKVFIHFSPALEGSMLWVATSDRLYQYF